MAAGSRAMPRRSRPRPASATSVETIRRRRVHEVAGERPGRAGAGRPRPGRLLGRTSSGTLRLAEDTRGLEFSDSTCRTQRRAGRARAGRSAATWAACRIGFRSLRRALDRQAPRAAGRRPVRGQRSCSAGRPTRQTSVASDARRGQAHPGPAMVGDDMSGPGTRPFTLAELRGRARRPAARQLRRLRSRWSTTWSISSSPTPWTREPCRDIQRSPGPMAYTMVSPGAGSPAAARGYGDADDDPHPRPRVPAGGGGSWG